jgi:heme/copper-type cytochrome/quinol oxidase subunit 2
MKLSETSIPLVLWSLVGVFGLLFASFRMISVFFSRNEERNIVIHETPIQSIFLTIGILILVIIGLFPNFYNNLFLPMMSVYENLY